MAMRPHALTLALLVCGGPALAQGFPGDFQLWKLGNPVPTSPQADPRANGNFRVFARQLGAVITAANGAPPDTLGHSGFAVALTTTSFDLQGGSLPTSGTPRGPRLLPGLHVRKGLPFSFEVGVRASWVPESRMGVGGVEVKWAILEGFQLAPDLAVRGFVSKVINSRDFDLTAGGFDLGIGKQLAIAGMVTLTPYAGWSLTFVGASTGTIDFRPGRTLADAERDPLSDTFVFSPVQATQNTHNRIYGGLRFIGGHALLNVEVSYALFVPFRDATMEARTIPGVLAVNGSAGLDF
ncbi:MAG: hypothetical protein INH41_06405 [Myxococcaceae bacterium]|jgi:hypothetical protein|nr:hypothetical protein [Myxococcaceae bacterium]